MKKLILDTETTGLHHQKDKAFALSFSWEDEETVTFLDLREKYSLGILKKTIAKADLLIGHNLKFDLHQLIQAGVPWPLMKDKKFHCTQIAEACLNEHKASYSLDNLGLEYFNLPKVDIVSQVKDHLGVKQLAKSKAMKQLSKMPGGVTAVFNDLGKQKPVKSRFVSVESIKYILGGETVFSPKAFLYNDLGTCQSRVSHPLPPFLSKGNISDTFNTAP